MVSLKQIWTIGHSTRNIEEFISILNSFGIELLVDIRSYPSSQKFPHFNKEDLDEALTKYGIKYHHSKDLGGRRKVMKNSKNTAWRNNAFRGYADYMETALFKTAIATLESEAAKYKVAYMCSEAVWWRCHRSLVSDYLKWQGWKVMHIMAENKAEQHPFTSAAKIINGELTYPDQQTLF